MNKRIITTVLIVVLFILVACDSPKPAVPKEAQTTQTNEEGVEYSIIYIEGMPCIWVYQKYEGYESRSEYAGLDCDWSRHPSHTTPTP